MEKPQLKTSPKDVFLNLLMMAMLYISVISLISLCFAYINTMFPDPLNYYRAYVLETIRFHSSMVVVAFPLLIILSRLIQKDVKMKPEKHELKFAKWLIYLTLFLAALALVIDLIQLVNTFYSGELTSAFLLKVLSVLVVAGAVFGYYLWDVQNKSLESNVPKKVAYASSAFVLVMLILGFVVAGSPAEQRKVRMDEARVTDLQMLQGEIVNYWQFKRELPTEITQVEDDIRGYKVPKDPETDAAYEYTMIAPLKFKLCATFDLKNNDEPGAKFDPYAYGSESWLHEAGQTCFERTIDPDLYPVNPVK